MKKITAIVGLLFALAAQAGQFEQSGSGGGGGGSGTVTGVLATTPLQSDGDPVTPTISIVATGVPLNKLATEAANTIVGNATGSTAVPGAISISDCHGSTNGLIWTAGTGFGCNTYSFVSTVSVASANGFAGTVSNPTTTPAITLSTSVNGLLKGNGTAVSAATAGTDYAGITTANIFKMLQFEAGCSNASASGAITINSGAANSCTDTITSTQTSNTSNYHFHTLTGNVTYTFSNLTNVHAGTLAILQDGIGNHTVTWGTGVTANSSVWINPTANSLTYVNWLYDGTTVRIGGGACQLMGTNSLSEILLCGNQASAQANIGVSQAAHTVLIGAGTSNAITATSTGSSGQALVSGGSSADPAFGVTGVNGGGTGLSSGTSGGILAFTASGTLVSSGALTANLPVIGGGAGVAPTVGTRSGNTTKYVTTTGTLTNGDCVSIDASGNFIDNGSACGSGGGGSGTVTSVAMTVPGIMSIAGSPVTTSGTLAVSLANETANTVWAGPSSGSAATPTFRALVQADMPLYGTNPQSGTTYTVLTSDYSKLVTFTNAASMAVTLPQSGTTGFGSNWFSCFKNINATSTTATAAGNTAFVTITPTTSTIDGGATIVLGAQQSICVYSDGTNYTTGGIKGPRTNSIIITATGATTWTKPPNIQFVRVMGCGAGGGGAAGVVTATDGSGGGGGGWCEDQTYDASLVSSTMTATVGTGGTAGIVGGTTTGGAGGETSFGSLTTMFGGGGGNVGGAGVGGGGGPGGPFGAGGTGTTNCGTAGLGTSNSNNGSSFAATCGSNGATAGGGVAVASGHMAAGGAAGGNGNAAGGSGGAALGCSQTTGGSGATTGTAGNGTSPTATNNRPGCGASGGGGATTGTGGVGGTGTNGSGGGGGGSVTGAGTAGNGGPGGNGFLWITAW